MLNSYAIHSADDYYQALDRIDELQAEPIESPGQLDMLLALTEAYETGQQAGVAPACTWSRRSPDKPGWYWFSGDSPVPPYAKRRPIIMEVTWDNLHKASLVARYSQGMWLVNEMSGDWAGPIDEPLYEEPF